MLHPDLSEQVGTLADPGRTWHAWFAGSQVVLASVVRQLTQIPPAARVWFFSLCLAGVAVALDLGVVAGHATGISPLRIPWPFIGAGMRWD